MYFSRRNLIIIISSLVVLGIIAVLLIWFKNNISQPANQNNQPTSLNDSTVNSNIKNINVPLTNDSGELAQVTDDQSQFQGVARLFAELYGSYSTDNPFANIKSVAALTTPNFQNKLNSSVNSKASAQFYAVSSRALSLLVVSQSANQAKVIVSTQRQEVKERGATPSVLYQKVTVDLIKTNNSWLVDGAVWE